MLEVLGFITLLVFSALFLGAAGSAIMLGAAFGKVDWAPIIFFGIVGSWLLWSAWKYSPFRVTFVGG